MSVGDAVVVTGIVSEFNGLTELTTITAFSKCGCVCAPCPAAASGCVLQFPDGDANRQQQGLWQGTCACADNPCIWRRTNATLAPMPLSLPAAADKAAALEPYEGMLVTVAGPLTVVGNYQLGKYGQVGAEFTAACLAAAAGLTLPFRVLCHMTRLLLSRQALAAAADSRSAIDEAS